ncbi:MAG TPA: FAD-binding oxidoreductase [Solirubrobacterales bacterium]|jgi:UDP-N-acetylenolpyruvoylglucosamine reductase|nr:FAD-binding oxidoreductase [Solirubrobacterales bacterium]
MDRKKTITLELLLAGDGLSGRALAGDDAREFSGRLGLMHTIDELLAAASPNEEERMNPTETIQTSDEVRALRRLIGGTVIGPEDAGWDAARQAFNLNVDQRPALIAEPGSREEVSAVVRFARDSGLRVAPQRTGHNAEPLGPLERTILLKTTRLDRVLIDPRGRCARVGAGARWEDVVPAASEHGLAALHGSTPDVSIAGYTLGGGMGWYARKHGLAANSVTAIELVTADGEIVCASASNEPELFWALRGGGGNFGVVTALEFDLYPVEEVYAGVLFFPFERAAEVLHAWHEWTAGVPDEVTSVGRLLQLPPLEEIPEPVRGKSFALIEAVFLGGEAEGAALLEPLRALGPAIDGFAMMPPAGIAELHMDPREPMPYASEHSLLGELPATAIDDLVLAAGPGSGSTLASVELRHTGGALARAGEHHGAIATLPGSFAMFAVGLAADPATTAKTGADLGRVAAALRQHEAGHYLNFVERRSEAESFFPGAVGERLLAAKDAYDPERLFQANHEIGADR